MGFEFSVWGLMTTFPATAAALIEDAEFRGVVDCLPVA